MCDGIFLNYNWTEERLRSSSTLAGGRKGEVYVGIDVFGRGCPGGGGYNSCEVGGSSLVILSGHCAENSIYSLLLQLLRLLLQWGFNAFQCYYQQYISLTKGRPACALFNVDLVVVCLNYHCIPSLSGQTHTNNYLMYRLSKSSRMFWNYFLSLHCIKQYELLPQLHACKVYCSLGIRLSACEGLAPRLSVLLKLPTVTRSCSACFIGKNPSKPYMY